ncbi:MAG: hypothetical protein AAGK97_10230, partial [Bacteroidota bacterium]
GTQTTVIEEFSDNYRLKNGIHQRIYLQAGVGVRILNRMELGLEGRFGYGYRKTAGTNIQGSELTSVGLNAKWLF